MEKIDEKKKTITVEMTPEEYRKFKNPHIMYTPTQKQREDMVANIEKNALRRNIDSLAIGKQLRDEW